MTATIINFLVLYVGSLISYIAGSAVVYLMLSPEIERLEAKIRELQAEKP